MTNTPDKASTEYDTLGQVLKECGLEESVEKAIPPSTSMGFFLGILVDTESCTLSITKERLDESASLVEDWLIRSKCTLKEQTGLHKRVPASPRIYYSYRRRIVTINYHF
jgi:hypothetical protein